MSDIPAPAADAARKETITVPDRGPDHQHLHRSRNAGFQNPALREASGALPEQMNNLIYGEMFDVIQACYDHHGKRTSAGDFDET